MVLYQAQSYGGSGCKDDRYWRGETCKEIVAKFFLSTRDLIAIKVLDFGKDTLFV